MSSIIILLKSSTQSVSHHITKRMVMLKLYNTSMSERVVTGTTRIHIYITMPCRVTWGKVTPHAGLKDLSFHKETLVSSLLTKRSGSQARRGLSSLLQCHVCHTASRGNMLTTHARPQYVILNFELKRHND